MNRIAKLFLISLIVILICAVGLTSAHDIEDEPYLTYYIAADENGVQQVFQHLLDGVSELRQLTHAENNVITFGTAYDGLGITYVSDGQLWLQPIHTEDAIPLATLSATQFFSHPIFSQDGNYIAYADNGVWLLDLATRETRQILANVELAADGSNMPDYRIYAPEVFVANADGVATKLVVDVGIWEWSSVGVYDLATGDFQELEGQLHTSLLPLSDGRALIFGNNGVGGESSLHIADSLDNINNAETLVYLSTLTEATLFAEQAIELESGIVRIFGTALTLGSYDSFMFYLDADVSIGDVTAPEIILLPQSTTGSTVTGQPSADGHIVPVYVDAIWGDFGTIFGNLQLIDVTTHEPLSYTLPETVSIFQTQP